MTDTNIATLERAALDLTRYAFQRPIFGKGITVTGTWFTDIEGRTQPCMVLTRTGTKIGVSRQRPCVIPLSDIFMFDEKHGNAEYAYGAAGVMAKALDSSDVMVLTVIQSEIGELMSMAPMPPEGKIVVADAEIRTHGRTQHLEIIENAR